MSVTMHARRGTCLADAPTYVAKLFWSSQEFTDEDHDAREVAGGASSCDRWRRFSRKPFVCAAAERGVLGRRGRQPGDREPAERRTAAHALELPLRQARHHGSDRDRGGIHLQSRLLRIAAPL